MGTKERNDLALRIHRVIAQMADPIEAVSDPETKEQLLWLRTNYGTIVEAERLGRLVRGFKSQKGI